MSEELKEIVALLGAMRRKKGGKVTWNDVRDFLDNELRDRPFEPHELLMKLRFIDETSSGRESGHMTHLWACFVQECQPSVTIRSNPTSSENPSTFDEWPLWGRNSLLICDWLFPKNLFLFPFSTQSSILHKTKHFSFHQAISRLFAMENDGIVSCSHQFCKQFIFPFSMRFIPFWFFSPRQTPQNGTSYYLFDFQNYRRSTSQNSTFLAIALSNDIFFSSRAIRLPCPFSRCQSKFIFNSYPTKPSERTRSFSLLVPFSNFPFVKIGKTFDIYKKFIHQLYIKRISKWQFGCKLCVDCKEGELGYKMTN